MVIEETISNKEKVWVAIESESKNAHKWVTPGDVFIGVLKSSSVNSMNNKTYIFEALDGSEATIYGTAVLNTKLGQVAVGEMVKIVYNGEVKGKNGRMYQGFDVYR